MSKFRSMRPYMVHGGDSRDGACLVFAHTVREARRVGFPILDNWECADWIDCRAELLRDKQHLFAEADQEKLAAGIAHAIESPKTCPNCELWGGELNENENGCEFCEGD